MNGEKVYWVYDSEPPADDGEMMDLVCCARGQYEEIKKYYELQGIEYVVLEEVRITHINGKLIRKTREELQNKAELKEKRSELEEQLKEIQKEIRD